MPSREYYLQDRNTRALQGYKQFAVSVATLLGAPADRAQQDMEKMVEFERTVANVRLKTPTVTFVRSVERAASRLYCSNFVVTANNC